MKHISRLIAGCSSIFLLIALTTTVEAQNIRHVSLAGSDQGGSNTCLESAAPCRAISHALDAAVPGDTIEVGSGAYTETLLIDKSVNIHGAGQSSTFIEAHIEPGSAEARVVDLGAGLVVEIANLTIRNGHMGDGSSSDCGAGIRNITNSLLILEHVSVVNNHQGLLSILGGAGVCIGSQGSAQFRHVVFQGNDNLNSQGGGALAVKGTAHLNHVWFTGNSAGGLGGGGLHVHGIATLEDVTFTENYSSGLGGGMKVRSGGAATLERVNFNPESFGPQGRVRPVA